MKDSSKARYGTMARKWNVEPRRDADALVDALARCMSAADVPTLQTRVLEGLEAGWGYRCGTFFLGSRRNARIAVDPGPIRGLPPESLSAYFAHFAEADMFAGARSRLLLERHGVVGFDELAPALTANERRYVDNFMEPFGIRSQLSTRVDIGLPVQGVLSIMSSQRDAFDERDRSVLLAMGAIVGTRLRELYLNSAGGVPGYDTLSPRERDVAGLAAAGYDNAAIACRLAVGIDTVKKHLAAAFRKVGVANRTQLALRWRASVTN